MKRSAPLKRVPFKRKSAYHSEAMAPAAIRAEERRQRIANQSLGSVKSLHKGTTKTSGTKAAPKPKAHRNPTLLAMAEGRPCLLRVPGVCNGDTTTTVAAHANWSWSGKGGARTADDQFSVWSCSACHIPWLDQPSGRNAPTKTERERAFMAAHLRQVQAWRVIAADPAEPPRFRKAALWALERLNATPIGGIE